MSDPAPLPVDRSVPAPVRSVRRVCAGGLPALLVVLALIIALGDLTGRRADAQVRMGGQPSPTGPTAVQEDDQRQMPDSLIFFTDLSYALYTRSVNYADAPDETDGAANPHVALGIGLWFGGDGLGKDLFDPLNKPFGIRIGVIFGGSFESKSPDVAAESDFTNIGVELEFLSPWNQYGLGPELLLSTWEFFGEVGANLEFRGQTLVAATKVKQKLEQYGGGWPITLFDFRIGIDSEAPSFIAIVPRYIFLQASLTSDTPPVRGTVSNHVLMGGIIFDWGVTDWLRASFQVDVGGILGYGDSAVSDAKINLTFIHIPQWWADNNLQFLAKATLEVTTLGLGRRYLFDPASTETTGTVVWVQFVLRLGLRIWF